MFRKAKKSISLILVLCFVLIMGSQIVLAKENVSEEKTIYKNEKLVRDVKQLEKMAVEVSKDHKGPKFSLKNNNLDKIYYEKGKIYKAKVSEPKQVIQKLSSIQKEESTIDKYVADGFATITIEEKLLDENTISALGLQDVEATTLSFDQLSKTVWSRDSNNNTSYAMQIKYTVYYDSASYGQYNNLYCLDHAVGQVLYADTASGVTPTSGECYYQMYGKAYDYSTYPPTFLATKSYGDTKTVSYPRVGTSYNFTLNPDIYLEGTVGTNWIVDATRGVSAAIYFEL